MRRRRYEFQTKRNRLTMDDLIEHATVLQPKLVTLEADEVWDELNWLVEELTGKDTSRS